jgi:lipopolysaccharide export system permease protein
MINIRKIDQYLVKEFIIKFIQIILLFAIIIFFINLFDALDKVKSSQAPIAAAPYMSFLQIGGFINDISPSIILIAALITFAKFSLSSEIIIIRIAGYSIFSLLRPILISGFVLGLIWISVINPIFIAMQKKFNNMEQIFINKEIRELISIKDKIWLRQKNITDGGEIIIKADGVYKNNIEFKNVKFLFIDNDYNFYQRLDARSSKLEDNNWILKDVIINNNILVNDKVDKMFVLTNLKKEFVREKIINNFQDVKLFSIFELPSIIKNMELSGFATSKFKVYYHSMLAKPILFSGMIMIACYFGVVHNRSGKLSLNIFIGIISGLIIYILISIIQNIGSYGLISEIKANWYPVILIVAISIILIYRKD